MLNFFTATLQLESIGKGLVHIYSPEVNRYIAMDSNGRLFSMVNISIRFILLMFILVRFSQLHVFNAVQY